MSEFRSFGPMGRKDQVYISEAYRRFGRGTFDIGLYSKDTSSQYNTLLLIHIGRGLRMINQSRTTDNDKHFGRE